MLPNYDKEAKLSRTYTKPPKKAGFTYGVQARCGASGFEGLSPVPKPFGEKPKPS